MNNYPNGPYPSQQPSYSPPGYPQGQSQMQQPPVQQKKKLGPIKIALIAAVIVIAVLLCIFFGGWH